ncbi:MAG: right-handed parallel beta-helix repeat-containing protein [Planctomycetes bacterium]|nr:right-handed parallel beta-helix repeat-containing protein [Planctomycetota bacterium]
MKMFVRTLAVVSTASIAAAGPINPPAGPVAPTPGPEPRTALSLANTPGDTDSVFRITQPGSYYLTANLASIAAGKSGIEIANSDVTIDLNGFQVQGFLNTNLHGVVIEAGIQRRNIVVKNGSVVQCGLRGVNLENGVRCTVENVHVTNVFDDAIHMGNDARVINCTAAQNTGFGIRVGTGSLVQGCTANINGAGIFALKGTTIESCNTRANLDTGIRVGGGCVVNACASNENQGFGIVSTDAGLDDGGTTITGCSATLNEQGGISVTIGSSVINCGVIRNSGNGVAAGSGCTVRGCSASFNAADGFQGGTGCTFVACTAFNNSLMGFDAGGSATVLDCTARANARDGIGVTLNSLVRGNTCSGNGPTPEGGSGILATSGDNRIEANNCVGNNQHGIEVTGSGSLIIGNSCSTNGGTEYNIAASNRVGPVVAVPASAAINGSTGGAGTGTTDPWANLSY